MTDVFQVLRQDHIEVKDMLARLSGSGATDGTLADQLIMEESRHEAAEEMYFWPSVREHVANGDQLADQAIVQENEGKEVLDALRKAEPGSAEFTDLVQKFASAGRQHIAFEEDSVWPLLERALTSDERNELGESLETAKRAAPTRPHPNAPASPGALKTVGTATAAADKMVDKIKNRGK